MKVLQRKSEHEIFEDEDTGGFTINKFIVHEEGVIGGIEVVVHLKVFVSLVYFPDMFFLFVVKIVDLLFETFLDQG